MCSSDAVSFSAHGSVFQSYVSPARGSREVCAWQLAVAARLPGAAHRPTRDEIMLVLSGELDITLDGVTSTVHRGAVILVEAHCEMRVDGGAVDATVWVTTTPGLEAVMADGTRLRPPWAN